MSETEHDETTAPDEPVPSAGQRLREAREARGLTIQDVASSLYLNAQVITALEQDDYAKLPSETFVKGYLRAYGRLLDLPEEALPVPQSAVQEKPAVHFTATTSQSSSRDLPVRLISLLIVVLVLGSAALWWVNHSDDLFFDRQVDGVADAPSPLSAQPAEPSIAPPVSVDIDVQEGVSESAGEARLADAEPALDMAQAGQEAADAGEVADVDAQVGADDTTEPVRSAPAGTAEVVAQAKVVLHYQSNSWTEITDNTGQQLVYGLVEAGEVLELKGEAPFSIFLGYAQGVSVYFNDELFDHTPFQRRDLARFRLGGPEHNRPVTR